MKSFIQRAGLVGAGVLAAIALAACGGATATSTPTTAAVATSAPAATASTANAPTAAAAEPTAASAPTAAAEPTAAATEPTAASVPAAATTKLNLNTVTEDELLNTIPGFGSRMVREFLEYRPYTSIQQFRKEIGKYVDSSVVSEYEKYVYVPINVNEADAATLQQISGVDATIAQNLIAARPYADNTAFLAKLKELAASVDTTQAQALLAQ
ncbi:MAG: helix-hairpin-helix domain-containing protein [Kouleothrix sp.]|jgi:DNA uptake protein ComE-like DNA-binding protein